MEADGERLAEHAEELLSVALEVEDSAADPSSAAHLPAALARVGEALDALSLAVEGAAASWPGTHGCDGPSYECQARLLSSFYEASATLRVSRRACARTTGLLVDLTAPLADLRPDR